MIYVTGDTHGGFRRFSSKNMPDGKTLTKRDFVVILGDFGGLWDSSKDEAYWLQWLSEKPWTTLFLDGNHENFNLINDLPHAKMFGADVGVAASSVYHLRRGRVYTIEGKTFYVMGGGLSVDKHLRREGKSWWAQENPSQVELDLGESELAKYKYKVDYVLTHTCPSRLVRLLTDWYSPKVLDPLASYFDSLDEKLDFTQWYFGHFHVNRSLTKNYDDADYTYTCLYERIVQLGACICPHQS